MKVSFHTLGCKVNIYETEVMEGLLREAGYEIVPFQEKADICVINTCTVTNIADRKSRQMIHKARKLNPEALIAAAGCYVQVQDREALLSEGIDVLIGADEKQDIVEILEEACRSGVRTDVADAGKTGAFRKMTLLSPAEHTRADIKVQDGCDSFCSYCIIPYARGRIRSKEIADCVREITALSLKGVREFVLTGIHLSSYGRDLPEQPSLSDLILAVSEIPGVDRIRLGSLEPGIVTEEFAGTVSKIPKLCPHFHLSLQSGDADTLKRMNRHYTPDSYERSCEILRKYFDSPALTTDIIVGFPGETEEAFLHSMAFAEKIGFYELHVFQYSRRKGTRADRMDGQIPEDVKKKRSRELIALGDTMSRRFEAYWEGKTAEVLTEYPDTVSGAAGFYGYTKEYIRVFVPGASRANEIVTGVLQRESGELWLLPSVIE